MTDAVECPAEEDLLPLATGETPSGPVGAHVSGCQRCRSRVDQMRSAVTRLQQLTSTMPTIVTPPPLPLPGTEPVDEPLPARIGRYLVVGRIARSGQAVVYRVVHPQLHSELVLKLSRDRMQDNEEARQRLLDEGRLLADLRHPGIAAIYDVDVYEDRPFLVLEFVRGEMLHRRVQRERLAPRAIAGLLIPVAEALHFAHLRGIVHRDLKPENIMIDDAGRVRLIDFGIAQVRDVWRDGADEAVTVGGTVRYMAPEQARAEVERIDPRTDVFGLGAVLFGLLTGSAPYHAETTHEALRRARECEFDRTALKRAHVPRGLRAICLKAMAPEPSDRFASAEAMARALRRYVRRPMLTAVGAAAALLLLLVWAAATWLPADPVRPAAPRSAVADELQPLLRVHRFGDVQPLERAMPLRSGDLLRVECRVPPGTTAAFYWLDSAGNLERVSPVDISLGENESVARYPAGDEGQVVSLVGRPGTEILLVCADAENLPSTEEFQTLVGSQPWPRLPASACVLANRDRVEVQYGDRNVRALGSSQQDALGQVEDRLDDIRQKVAARCEFFAAVAFPHSE